MEEEKQQTPATPATAETKKPNDNMIMGIISYLSFLCFIPLFTKKDNEFVYFHAKQGLVLFILEIIVYVLSRILVGIFIGSLTGWTLLSVFSVIINLLNLGLLVLSIIGIINVVQNQKKELPLVGKFAHKIKI
ncbi:MAG: hypothetical protein GYA31_01925 [Parcubacteria group bacterium]|nr:hypothetical protein [Parcubacteria group bacterium]